MKVHIKTRTNGTAQFVHSKTHVFGEDQEMEMIFTQEFDMKVQGTSTQAGLQNKGD
jgi:hypothetical protein